MATHLVNVIVIFLKPFSQVYRVNKPNFKKKYHLFLHNSDSDFLAWNIWWFLHWKLYDNSLYLWRDAGPLAGCQFCRYGQSPGLLYTW